MERCPILSPGSRCISYAKKAPLNPLRSENLYWPLRRCADRNRKTLDEMPLHRPFLPERRLGRPETGLEALRMAHLAQVVPIRLVLDGKLAQRLFGKLNRQRFFVEPDRCSPSCEARFPIEPPMAEAYVPSPIEASPEACGVEDAVKLIGWTQRPTHPA